MTEMAAADASSDDGPARAASDLRSAAVPAVGAGDHVRGSAELTVIAYGDYECPYCARTDRLLRTLAVRVSFRHFPVRSKHSRARALAAAAEAAALQGSFWKFHDSLFDDQGHIDDPHLWERARRLGLDLERFERDRRSEGVEARVERDFRGGIRAGVVSTPALVFDGRLWHGVPDADVVARLDRGVARLDRGVDSRALR